MPAVRDAARIKRNINARGGVFVPRRRGWRGGRVGEVAVFFASGSSRNGSPELQPAAGGGGRRCWRGSGDKSTTNPCQGVAHQVGEQGERKEDSWDQRSSPESSEDSGGTGGSGGQIERPGGERGMVVEGKWKREVRASYRRSGGGVSSSLRRD